MVIFLGLLRQFWYAVPILLLFVWGQYWNHEAKDCKKDFDVYRAQVETAGEKSKALELEKEKNRAKSIADSVAARDVALARLRVEQARPRSGFVSAAPAGSKDPGRVCYQRAELDAALRKLDSGVSGLVGEGDAQLINGRAILQAWPR